VIYDVIIIGAGPAGISTAVEAVRAGIRNVLVVEKGHTHSFSIWKFYTDGKRVDAAYRGEQAVCEGAMCILDGTKETTLETIEMFIRQYDLNIRYNTTVETMHKENEVFFITTSNRETYQAKTVVIAIGMLGRPNKPDYKIPPELKAAVFFDLNNKVIEGKQVLVVGGGNSAAEYAEYLHTRNSVALSYRKPTFTRLNEINLQVITQLASEKKIELLMNTNITELCSEQGKPKVMFQELAPRLFDVVVYALGGTTPENFLQSVGIHFEGKQPRIKENYETNISGLYLAGDLVAGGKGTIIKAFNTGKKIVHEGLCADHFECNL